MTTKSQQMTSKPFYRRCRYWAIAIVLVLIYFSLIPSRLRVSPETTLITSPLKSDGTPDYFRAWSEKTWLPKLSPPEDNGQRLMIAACGPRILEQVYIAKTVPWEEMPTHEYSKQWFAEYWTPLCEAMGIDPLAKPPYLDCISVTTRVFDKKKALEDESEAKEWDCKIFEERFMKTVWKTADHPEVAGWLADYKPVLDLFGVAVRKPNFEAWRKTAGSMIDILLPDVQASREFIRCLDVRVSARIGDGDIDGALYDVMSMYRLARHYHYNDIFVTKLVGCAAEGIANESLLRIIKSGKATKEQLVQFYTELKTLPSNWDVRSVQTLCESWFYIDTVIQINAWGKDCWRNLTSNGYDDLGLVEKNPSSLTRLVFERILFSLPFDANIAGQRILENRKRVPLFLTDWQSSPFLWLKFAKESDEQLKSNDYFQVGASHFLTLPLIRTRSEYISDLIENRLSPALHSFVIAIVRNGMQTELMQLAIQLECYKFDTGKYPDSLDKLVPDYIDEVPLDHFTGRKTLTYKLAPEDGTEYILYSFGTNGIDDNGLDDPDKSDIVIRR
ncbi:MAG: hypothetical protein LBU65_15635 [Planctomycetaceae bacterium]|jgi:hypothetical protein|nr:hypothetical protein [Planctomycetaceae bacterium]